MPLRTTEASEDERRQIEQEWETERAYSLANLTVKRRAGLRFVPAARSDADWAAYARNVLADKPRPSAISTKDDDKKASHSIFYRDLARSGSSAPASRSTTPSNTSKQRLPVATSSRVTIEELDRQLQVVGTAEVPIELDHDDNETGTSQGQGNASQVLPFDHGIEVATPRGTVTSEGLDQLTSEAGLSIPTSDVGSLYCLICQTVVPASDISTHESTILHNISKNPQYTVAQPLIPPTHYAIRAGNVGYEMMKKLGWAEEQGLGVMESGRKVPLRAVEKFDRKGVGVEASRKRLLEENEGKASKGSAKATTTKTAKPLAKNKRELLQAQRGEMQQFKAGLAYLNS